MFAYKASISVLFSYILVLELVFVLTYQLLITRCCGNWNPLNLPWQTLQLTPLYPQHLGIYHELLCTSSRQHLSTAQLALLHLCAMMLLDGLFYSIMFFGFFGIFCCFKQCLLCSLYFITCSLVTLLVSLIAVCFRFISIIISSLLIPFINCSLSLLSLSL